MAQAMPSPDYVQSSADPSMNAETGGKKSFFDKIKNKTRDETKKLKTKFQPGSKGEDNEEQVISRSSQDEAETPKTPKTPALNTTDDYESQPQTEGGQAPVSEHGPDTNVGGIFGKGEFEPQEDEDALSKEFAGLSTTDTGESNAREPTPDLGAPLENKEEEKPVTEDISEGVLASKDAAAVGAPDATANESGKSGNSGRSWSQWAAEKVGYGKDDVASKAPTTTSTHFSPTATPETGTPEEGKTVTQRAYDAAIQAKDTIHQQAIKPVYDKFTGAKSEAVDDKSAATAESGAKSDAVDDKSAATAESAQPSDPSQKSYMQMATSGIYAAKDSLFTSTHPGEDDRALSKKVTETVGNLPATIKSTMGFGGAKSPTSSSPTTTPDTTQTASDEAEGAPPQSPGIVSRFTSLLGVVKKPISNKESETTPDVTMSEGSTDTKMSEAAAE